MTMQQNPDGSWSDGPMTAPTRASIETLRCIYCQRVVEWPMVEPYPSACLHCGRWPGAYTAAKGLRWRAMTAPTRASLLAALRATSDADAAARVRRYCPTADKPEGDA